MQSVRLIYASKASQQDEMILRQDLMNILTTSIIFNEQQHIYGVLYYGHGYFVQCLEGDSEVVQQLYQQRILKDPRHHQVVLLSFQMTDEIQFKRWNMKLIPSQQSIEDFFFAQNLFELNPKMLNQEQLPEFLKVLLNVA